MCIELDQAGERRYSSAPDQGCAYPPEGWYCTRAPGHEGPCAVLPSPAVTQAAPSESVAIEGAYLNTRGGVTLTGAPVSAMPSQPLFAGYLYTTPAPAQQAEGDARDAVIAAARAWWEGHRPADYSEADHLANPAVNCAGFTEDVLARAIASATTSTEGK